MPVPLYMRICDTDAAKAREKYQEVMQRRKLALAELGDAVLVSRAISAEQLNDALQAEVDGLKAYIKHARLAGRDAPAVLRDNALQLLFVDEARRRRGL